MAGSRPPCWASNHDRNCSIGHREPPCCSFGPAPAGWLQGNLPRRPRHRRWGGTL
jgi:hypothetical protein